MSREPRVLYKAASIEESEGSNQLRALFCKGRTLLTSIAERKSVQNSLPLSVFCCLWLEFFSVNSMNMDYQVPQSSSQPHKSVFIAWLHLLVHSGFILSSSYIFFIIWFFSWMPTEEGIKSISLSSLSFVKRSDLLIFGYWSNLRASTIISTSGDLVLLEHFPGRLESGFEWV